MAYYKCGSIHPTQNSNVVVDTASGAIANFNTPLALPLLKTRFDFKATQDLHGQSGPYPPGGSAQKWDEETANGYLSSTDGSFISNDTSICSKNFNSILPSTDYFLFKGSSTPATYICLYDTNQEFIKIEPVAGVKITTPNNAAYFKVSCYGYGATYKNDISINYPATDTAYHPYSNICQIDGVSEIDSYHKNKNLLEKPFVHFSQVSDSLSDMFFVKAGTYIVNFPNAPANVSSWRYALRLKDINGNNLSTEADRPENGMGWRDNIAVWLDGANSTRKYRVFTFNQDCYIRVLFGFAETSETTVFDNVQLELGSTATDYEPYVGNERIINLGGTYYGGHFTQDKDGHRQFEVTHKAKVKLRDVGYWNYSSSGNRFYVNNLSDVLQKTDLNDHIGLCDCYVEGKVGNNQGDDFAFCFYNASLYLRDSNYSDVTTWLNAVGDYYITYQLATPIIIDLPDGQPIKSLPGVNNIFADTGDTSLQFRKIG